MNTPQEKKLILLVEDEHIIAIANAEEIKNFGYDVVIAGSSDEAIKIVQKNVNINLILMDIDLGEGIDGTEVAEIILRSHDIPVVFLSSHIEPEVVAKTEKITSYGYVVKNSSNTVILASIKMAFKLFEAKQKVKNEIIERQKAEEALRASEESLSTTLYSIGDAVIATDVNGRITRMNKTAERLTEWSFSEAEHQPLLSVFNIVNASTGKQVINPVEKVLETGQIIGLANHTVLISRGGNKVQISDSAAPILDKQGRVSGVILVFSDITEKYEVEEKLRQSEEKFRSLVETAQELVWKCDANGCFTYLNPAWEKTHGYRVEEMLGRGFGEFQRPEVFTKDIIEFSRHLAGGFVREYETTHISKNGKELTLLFNAIPLFSHDGAIVGTQGTATDITDRKRSESIFLSIIDKNPMSIQIVDKEGYTIKVNAAHTALFGSVPPSDYSIFRDMQISQLGLGDLLERVKKGEVIYFPDIHYNAHNVDTKFPDMPVWIRTVIFPLNDSKGMPERFVLMHDDITDQKRAEGTLRGIIEKNPMSIQIVDKEGYTISVNAAHTALFGSIPPADYSIFADLQIMEQGLIGLMDRVKNGEVVFFPDFHFNAHDIVPEFPDKQVWIRMVIFSLMDSNGRPERFVLMHEDITTRKHAEEKISTLLAEKELILKEVHHRIKNNMTVISSLLSLQAADSNEDGVITALDDARSRIQSMVLLYDKLYLSINFEAISILEYLPVLIDQIINNFPNSTIVKIEKQIDDFILDSKKLSSLGIIINELLTNTMKYAFTNRKAGIITVEAKLLANNIANDRIVSLSIQDNGNGIPDSMNFENSAGFGLRLIEILTKQLKGKLQIERNNGTKITLEFKL